MRLKLQMLLAGAVTLAIPFAGWHSIRQLDEALEDTRRREQTLRVANASAALAQNTALQALLQTRKRSPQPNDIYASKAKFPIFLDGYADDWRELNVTQFRFTPTDDAAQEDSSMLSVRASVREHNLYLFIRIADDDVVFHRPPRQVVEYAEGERPDPFAQLSNGDALELLVQRPSGNATHGLFRAVAPGPLMARVASATDRRRLGQSLGSWRGHWTTDNDGLRLEVVMPRPPDGASFGLAYVDVATRGDPKPSWVGNLSPVLMAERHSSDRQSNTDPRLTIASLSADVQLKPWVSAGTRLRVFDAHGLLLADVNQLYANDADNIAFDLAKSSFWDALVFRFVSAMLRDRDDADTDTPLFERVNALHLPADLLRDMDRLKHTRRYLTDEADMVLGSLTKLPNDNAPGYLLFESNDQRASAYASSRLAQLLSSLTVVSALVASMLLMFATVLSIRIRKLSKLASSAVSQDGRVAAFTPTTSNDEIGELSRTLAALLGRSAQYTDYLEALSSRLSHELRTPLSVVKTSLENVDSDKLDEETQRLLRRADGGADQLGHIIRALVESTRIEQTVQRAQKVRVALRDFAHGAQARYRQIYPEIDFELNFDATGDLVASPELLQQALDKLVDNAVSFTTNAVVTLHVKSYRQSDAERVSLVVSNAGHVPPECDLAHVFDPMFSHRAQDDGNLHLGLGLYIVKMVAEAHRGEAAMSSSKGFVNVGMDLPRNMHAA